MTFDSYFCLSAELLSHVSMKKETRAENVHAHNGLNLGSPPLEPRTACGKMGEMVQTLKLSTELWAGPCHAKSSIWAELATACPQHRKSSSFLED